MAKRYRVIKFIYDSTTYEIDVNVDNETADRTAAISSRRTLDQTLYEQILSDTIKSGYSYKFEYCNQAVYDFFWDAHEAKLAGSDIEFSRENDDGTFTTFDCTLSLPQWDDENISDTIKAFKGFECKVTEL